MSRSDETRFTALASHFSLRHPPAHEVRVGAFAQSGHICFAALFLVGPGAQAPGLVLGAQSRTCGAADHASDKPTMFAQRTSRGKPPPTKWEAPDFPAEGGSEETTALPARREGPCSSKNQSSAPDFA